MALVHVMIRLAVSVCVNISSVSFDWFSYVELR